MGDPDAEFQICCLNEIGTMLHYGVAMEDTLFFL
jgi:hypothetical protein